MVDINGEVNENDRKRIDGMQFELRKYYSEIGKSRESLQYRSINNAHRFMQKMADEVKNMNGKAFVAEKRGVIDFYKRVGLMPHDLEIAIQI